MDEEVVARERPLDIGKWVDGHRSHHG
jgi:hypothetical protein